MNSTENKSNLNLVIQVNIFSRVCQCLNCRCCNFQAVLVLLISILILIYCNGTFHSPLIENEEEEQEKFLIPPNPIHPLPPSKSKLQIFRNSAICSDSAVCSEIGRDIFGKNGSAVDVIIAAMICDGIINMQSMGLGGGFMMIVYKKRENKTYSINARETAPEKATNEMFKQEATSFEGPLSIGVPGQIKGFGTSHQRFGQLQWKDLVEPSIKLCERGYKMTKYQYSSLKLRQNLTDDENLQQWFYTADGHFNKVHSTIVPKALCNTLKILAKNGPDDFYTGHLSKLFLQDIEEMGGIITAEELANYEVEWQKPFSIDFKNGDRFYSSPPPGSGAVTGFILNILEGYNFTKDHVSGVENITNTYHRIIESFKYAFAKRTDLGDPNFVNMRKVLKKLSSKEYAAEIRSNIKDYTTNLDPNYYGASYYSQSDQGTSHISVIAPNGDAVSVTSTINFYFGAGITSRRTGIILNNVIDGFSFPHKKNHFDLTGSPNNKMEPGKRPLSSMTPSIIIDKNDEVKLVVGGSGGTQITSSIVLAVIRTLWFGETVKQAIDGPRFHHQLSPMVVEYEYGILQQVVSGLRHLGHNMTRGVRSVVCALQKDGEYIAGNADYRKGGDVSGN